jgi:membrane-bound lytic murein transglycosylase D
MEEPIPMKLLCRRPWALGLLSLGLTGCASLGGPATGADTQPPAPIVVASPVLAGVPAAERPVAPAARPAPAPAPAPAAASAPVAATAVAKPVPAATPAQALPLPPETPAPPPVLAEGESPAIEGDRSDLWARIRSRMAIADLDGDRVRRWEQYYAQRPEYVERMFERGGRYLFHVVEEVERRGLPAELALLPFIESAFNPQAMSRARASGMWQFMPATGKDFELRQNLFRDDRRSVRAATGAALDYLQRLHTRFGDWHLALAAYNWGQGNVSRAIERNQRARRPADYLSLTMPLETRDYVPKLQAVKNIVLDPARFGLTIPPLENHPFFASVAIDRDIDVGLAAELAGIPLAEFQALNPQLNKPVILAAGTPEVLLPWARAEAFRTRLANARGPLASWTAWVAPRTLKPAEVARELRISEAELREANRIPPGMRVRQGSTLLVPRPASQDDDVAAHVADTAQLLLAPEARGLRRLNVRIGRQGESVASVARRHRVSAVQVARWNGVSPRASFRPGQTVVVMVSAPAPRRAAAPARARRAEAPARAPRASAKASRKPAQAQRPAARPQRAQPR